MVPAASAQPATLDPNPTYLPVRYLPLLSVNIQTFGMPIYENFVQCLQDIIQKQRCAVPELISNLSLEGFYFIVKAHRYKYEIKVVTESGLYKSCHMRLQSFFSFDLLASCLAIASLTLSSLLARGKTGLPLRGNESPRFGGCSPRARL